MFGTITPVIECKIPTPSPSLHTFNTCIGYSIYSNLYSTKYILIQVSKFICVIFSITFLFPVQITDGSRHEEEDVIAHKVH